MSTGFWLLTGLVVEHQLQLTMISFLKYREQSSSLTPRRSASKSVTEALPERVPAFGMLVSKLVFGALRESVNKPACSSKLSTLLESLSMSEVLPDS